MEYGVEAGLEVRATVVDRPRSSSKSRSRVRYSWSRSRDREYKYNKEFKEEEGD